MGISGARRIPVGDETTITSTYEADRETQDGPPEGNVLTRLWNLLT